MTITVLVAAPPAAGEPPPRFAGLNFHSHHRLLARLEFRPQRYCLALNRVADVDNVDSERGAGSNTWRIDETVADEYDGPTLAWANRARDE